MTHVFISYKREDELRVGRLARALERSGLDVWWDRGLPAGESWHANIEAKLRDAGCVVVVWSNASSGPEGSYVRDEARHGLVRGILVPVLIDPLSSLPLGFGEVQAIDLARWKGSVRDPFFRDLVASIRAKLAGSPSPKAKGPSARLARKILYGALSTTGLLTALTLLVNAIGPVKVASQVCAAPLLQPGLSDVCGACGVGERPTRAERLAWEALPAGSCSALRDHVARFPDGAYRSQAADLLAARQLTYKVTWAPSKRSLPMFQPADGRPAPTQAAARSDALARSVGQARSLCRGFGAGTLFRFAEAEPRAEAWSCRQVGGGAVCGFDGWADCRLEERREAEHETCGAS